VKLDSMLFIASVKAEMGLGADSVVFTSLDVILFPRGWDLEELG
jgi:hypothetical protein